MEIEDNSYGRVKKMTLHKDGKCPWVKELKKNESENLFQ